MLVAGAAEALPVALFNELARRELPSLLRARAQTRELLRIHAERARHFDLPRCQPADLLRIRPRLLVVCSTLLRHAPTSCSQQRSSTQFQSRVAVKEYVNSQPSIPKSRRGEHMQNR